MRPDCITLVSNDIPAASFETYGLNATVLRFESNTYPFGNLDVALRRNVGIWFSEASHIITFDDDQLAPVNLVSSAAVLLTRQPYFWGHHRYIDFKAHSIDELLRLPADVGRPREFPPNSWHSFRSAYAGLFGAERELLVDVGAFDMLFCGRHGGEDQDLGRRLAERISGTDSIFVNEPPFAWHPEEAMPWDERLGSNLCVGDHVIAADTKGLNKCTRCPYFWAPDELLFRDSVGLLFDPEKLTTLREKL